MQGQQRIVTLERDYYFRATPAPLESLADEGIRSLVLQGKLQLMKRRDTTPNTWGVVPAGRKGGDYVQPESWQRLEHFCPDLSLLQEEESSTERVDYGPGMAAYIPIATTSAFADAGLPLWTRFRVCADKVDKALARRARAVAAAEWFNAQYACEPRKPGELSDLALLLLGRGAWRGGYKLWMYRKAAGAYLELVRAGYARVDPTGYLVTDGIDHARGELRTRNVALRLVEPPHIEARLQARASNPRSWTTGYRARHPRPHPVHDMV